MRKIRVKNQEELVATVVDIASYKTLFFIGNDTYDNLKEMAQLSYATTLKFIKSHEGYAIETTMDFKVFCDNFYILEEITCNNGVVYIRPDCWSDKCTIVIEAE